MPTTPIRTQGEPPTREDMLDLVKFLETGRAPNPGGRAEEIDAILQTDLPVSGHGDDMYLYEVDDVVPARGTNPGRKMTIAEAKAEAQRRWGEDDGHAEYGPTTPGCYPSTYKVGWYNAAGNFVTSGESHRSFEDAFVRSRHRPSRPNPSSEDSHQNQPPKAKWVLKGSPFPAMGFMLKRERGEEKPIGWKTMALLNNGNSKVGCYTWSIPEGATCPGRSAFCLDCYAVKMAAGVKKATMMGSRVIRLKAWAEHRDWWKREMIAECRKYGAFAPIRIHVAGDFFNAEYTKDWEEVVRECPGTYFWAYTRSWAADRSAKGGKALVDALESLRALPNITLYASFDPTMPVPPQSWLWAGIYGDPRMGTNRKMPRPAIICPEIAGSPQDWKGIREQGKSPLGADGLPRLSTCRKCGWCWNTTSAPLPAKVREDSEASGFQPMRGARGDVAFPRHGSIVELPEPGSIPWSGPMPTKEEVARYSIDRNGGGEGNRVVYSDAMKQLRRSREKAEMASAIVERDRQDHAAKFYMKEFGRLIGSAGVAFREMEV